MNSEGIDIYGIRIRKETTTLTPFQRRILQYRLGKTAFEAALMSDKDIIEQAKIKQTQTRQNIIRKHFGEEIPLQVPYNVSQSGAIKVYIVRESMREIINKYPAFGSDDVLEEFVNMVRYSTYIDKAVNTKSNKNRKGVFKKTKSFLYFKTYHPDGKPRYVNIAVCDGKYYLYCIVSTHNPQHIT